MTFLDLLGYAGFIFLIICWIPQTIATIKNGKIDMQLSFLLLYVCGSSLLMFQSIGLNNLPLILVNSYTTIASLINLFYGIFPRKKV